MKCLIAGGAGFIGSHLTERLVSLGADVTVVDNLITGDTKNLRDISSKVDFYESDISDFRTDKEFDAVFHLATVANTYDYMRCAHDVLRSSSFGTANLLEIAERSSSRFYYFSSSEIYGHRCAEQNVSVSEDSFSEVALLNDRSPYFVGKMFSEEYVRTFCEMKGLEYLIIRPFNIYGTKMDPKSECGRVITNFFKQASSGQPLTIYGDGGQTRSFCHVDDLIDALILLDGTRPWKYNVVNIGNPETISINNLAERISSLLNKELKKELRPSVPFEPKHRKPDLKRLTEWLEWKPRINITEGLNDIFLKEIAVKSEKNIRGRQ